MNMNTNVRLVSERHPSWGTTNWNAATEETEERDNRRRQKRREVNSVSDTADCCVSTAGPVGTEMDDSRDIVASRQGAKDLQTVYALAHVREGLKVPGICWPESDR